MDISSFIKVRRKALKPPLLDLASEAGVGLRFIRELEKGKQVSRNNRIDQFLLRIGHELGTVLPSKNKRKIVDLKQIQMKRTAPL